MVSTHPTRAIMAEHTAQTTAKREAGALLKGYGLRRVTGECGCKYTHPGTPEGQAGCGAPFALWIWWSNPMKWSRWSWKRSGTMQWLERTPLNERRTVKKSAASAPQPLDVEEERALQDAAATQLKDTRKAAESWRTGLGGFLAILIALFFVKGKSSFDDISGSGWKWALGGLLVASAVLALFGAYRAIRAAYGVPRDEYVGEVPLLFRPLPATSPRHIYDYGTVSAWRHAMARTSVNDLRWAKLATLGSLATFVFAAAITWVAPGQPAAKYTKVTYRQAGTVATVCGESVKTSTGSITIRLAPNGTQDIPVSDLVSVAVVKSCD
jgi:hypothetical protein